MLPVALGAWRASKCLNDSAFNSQSPVTRSNSVTGCQPVVVLEVQLESHLRTSVKGFPEANFLQLPGRQSLFYSQNFFLILFPSSLEHISCEVSTAILLGESMFSKPSFILHTPVIKLGSFRKFCQHLNWKRYCSCTTQTAVSLCLQIQAVKSQWHFFLVAHIAKQKWFSFHLSQILLRER